MQSHLLKELVLPSLKPDNSHITALSTFRILQDPLRAFPQTMLEVSQVLVALRRLLEYFQGDEVKPESIERLLRGEDYAVIVKVSSCPIFQLVVRFSNSISNSSSSSSTCKIIFIPLTIECKMMVHSMYLFF
jgi:hypothetical protein